MLLMIDWRAPRPAGLLHPDLQHPGKLINERKFDRQRRESNAEAL